MQEEVDQRVIALCITGTRVTSDVLKTAMRKFLSVHERGQIQRQQIKLAQKSEKAKLKVRRKMKEKETPRGKQSLTKLMNQGMEIKNVEITEQNIKSFDKIARKYGIDYSMKKDVKADSPRYLVFFKARDVDVMTAAFREYAEVTLKEQKKPSVKKKLEKAKERVAKHRQRVKVKKRERGQSL